MKRLTLSLLACCTMAAGAWAQDVPVDREKYPDYVDPTKVYKPDARLLKYVEENMQPKSRSKVGIYTPEGLPDHWNNAEVKHFPPVFNQAGGSCGSASRFGYMFTHEINSLRDADANLPENQYPTHFAWLFTSGNDGKEAFGRDIGIPTVEMYGGRTFSALFGYQEDTQDNFGWMTGYDKWMNAIGNRMYDPTFVPFPVNTPEGMMAAKAWLYNHAGDTDFHSGGLIGLGVASQGVWYNIPQTEANDAAGVTGKYYVQRWGVTTDHAVTMVGYDDRIEFDLDQDGIVGEDGEVGAWIIVNSWGGWCNDGFIYCPYKYAGPMSNQTTGELTGGYWYGELYNVRKNFRPLRAIKLKMNYTHRSELFLQIGISTDLNATEPEAVVDMHHFRYAGDGKNGNTDPAPAVPMLGSWQGTLHHEPMEWVYDLTDMSANFDQNRPLKYFFIINRKKDTNAGEGNIYEASIVDMDADREGVETPFDLGGEKYEITQEGKKLMISTIVYGKGYNPVNNLALSEGTLSWSAPSNGSYVVASYNVYKDDALLANTASLSHVVEGGQIYAVSAVYEDGTESEKVSIATSVPQNDVALYLNEAGFAIPDVFSSHYQECTIEFWVKPTLFSNWNNQAGPNWGTYLHHFNANGTFSCGWDTNDRINTTETFSTQWQHIAIVVDGNKMQLYKNGKSIGSKTSTTYSGLGGFGDFVFRSGSASEWQNAYYDEIRIWDHARTQKQIRGGNTFRRQEFYGDLMPNGLLVYYKGDIFQGEDGTFYMREYVKGNHAPIHKVSANPQADETPRLVKTPIAAEIALNVPEAVYAGQPVCLSATRSDGVNKMWWDIEACGISQSAVVAPTVTFAKAGTYQVAVTGAGYNGKVLGDTIQLVVLDPMPLDATFAINKVVVPCGEHVSMHVNTFTEGCSYEWSMSGANVETVYGAKAGATYEVEGDYTVALKVTSADGRVAESSQTITVTAVAPVASFYVSEPVVLKGTPTTLKSTTSFSPTALEWTLKGQANTTTILEGAPNQEWTPQYPGRYDITLRATNAIGNSEQTQTRALIVTNAESGSGLNFSMPTAQVAIPTPLDEMHAFTIEFWANPSSLNGSCWGIGQDVNTFLIKVNGTGTMTVSIDGKTYRSPDGFVEAGVWNHYAIARSAATSSGTIRFMRNGQLMATVGNTTATSISKADMPNIILGVDGAPIMGSIDEFRIWQGNQYSKMKKLCNQPIDDPSQYEDLYVYYDFNQTRCMPSP